MTAAALIFTTCVIAGSEAFASPSSASYPPTQVTIFRPSLPLTGGKQQGHCWAASIAVNRSDAWRCMRGNMIYDPCFQVTGRARQVICGVNPVEQKKGFILSLTQPLPSRGQDNAAFRPWLIELSDGSLCESATGTMAVVEGQPVRYPCNSPSPYSSKHSQIYCGLVDQLHTAKVWKADKVCFTVAPSENGPPFQLQRRETVAIRRIWE